MPSLENWGGGLKIFHVHVFVYELGGAMQVGNEEENFQYLLFLGVGECDYAAGFPARCCQNLC